jgi:hypothetical protein
MSAEVILAIAKVINEASEILLQNDDASQIVSLGMVKSMRWHGHRGGTATSASFRAECVCVTGKFWLSNGLGRTRKSEHLTRRLSSPETPANSG